MRLRWRGRRFALAGLAVLMAAAGTGWALHDREDEPRPELELFTTLPIMWGETGRVAEIVSSPEPRNPVLALLEARYRVVARDMLDPPASLHNLLIAQPRILSPEENVSLDDWVRDGGRVLMFADPMLTWPTRFPIGDRRRPQDVALVSPILARWGLGLRFDDSQPQGERDGPGGFPVNLRGSLALAGKGHDSHCMLSDGALVATCKVGWGRVTVVADAAVLEPGGDGAAKIRAIGRLLDSAFAD